MLLVEVTTTDPLENLVWVNRMDSDGERNKKLNRTENQHPAFTQALNQSATTWAMPANG